MAGERRDEGDLQRRIGMFDTDGTLEASCREIWTLIEPEKEAIARAYASGVRPHPARPHERRRKKAHHA